MGPRWRIAVLAGLFALVTACGGGGGQPDGVASLSEGNTPSSSDKADPDEPDDPDEAADQMRAYAKCMREHGVDMPDPEVSQDGGISMSIEGGDRAKVDKADQECKHLMPNGGEPEKPSPEDLDRMRAEAQCLRDHGIDVKDPTMDNPGIQIEGAGPDDEKFRKAMEECSDGKGTVSSGGGK
ncbi:hypothetical protein [Actinophytocola algeriensis]|uniref:Secreted protein n=1 Tax=Actinophytocola algeriensis TaxID=1768010 RepID=A0A7W7QF77_9PSEU|nr:hypothetical protein [Actinophytocola algeriensis]MBB4912545.1 hypothetical protein [Actinophytocola algeriensis]MBE1478919.1 hypothetical protein [Actinophytocola algeriensis]